MKALRLIPLAAVLVVAGCATTASKPKTMYLTPAEWEQRLRERGVDPRRVADPLAVTPAMKEEAEQMAGVGTDAERLHRLQEGLFTFASAPFTYENRGTFTAAEAFHRREGNCLSFTNLFVALARSLDMPVTTALVLRARGSEREGDLIVVNNHVIAVLLHAGGTEYYDFDRTRDRRPTALAILDDMWITALYLNNRGADELRNGHPEAALRLFEDAVKIEPDFAGGWGNLGVTRRRAGDVQGAFAAYERALEITHDDPTVLANLAALYRSLGRESEAQKAITAGDVNRSSPHVLIVRGDLELAQGKAKTALALYKKARALESRSPDVWSAMARAELALGEYTRARRYAKRALTLRADDPEAKGVIETLDTRSVTPHGSSS